MKIENIGVWLDRNEAHIISYHPDDKSGEDQKVKVIISDIEDNRIGKGYGSGVKYLAQDASDEKMLLERRKHQEKQYFDSIADAISEATGVYLFGPGELKKKFKNYLDENHKKVAKIILAVDAADSVSENQKKEMVRTFFNTTLRKG